jgi:hypothetical protein
MAARARQGPFALIEASEPESGPSQGLLRAKRTRPNADLLGMNVSIARSRGFENDPAQLKNEGQN